MTRSFKTTDCPPNWIISTDMADRIEAGRLDYRRAIGWHDPRGYHPEKTHFGVIAERLAR